MPMAPAFAAIAGHMARGRQERKKEPERTAELPDREG